MNDLEQLSTLDPMRDFEPGAERRGRATAALERTFREPGPTRQNIARRNIGWRLALGGVMAVALGTIGAVTLTGDEPDRAYASWTATPNAVSAADALPQARQCAEGWTDGGPPPTAADILLAERRGDATLVLVRKDGTGLTSCFVLDPEQGAAGADLLDTTAPAPAPGRVRNESSGATEGGEGWYSSMIGRAGAGVEKVEIELPDGTEVRASLRDGWWAAWWPGHEGGVADGVRIVVHTAGGSDSFLPSEVMG
ncbi:hypothetical protein JIG36_46095 [Actinoplanes sp. LDG1-06]|uniref:Uncharacterized protein n=1 Tax=Paractinoplanes ovalisporus TaxID=2810368 RepID=A0ABS2ASS3_9ACTN|nr:hypothetical protein [Actinoplanes ovalisporus]MBM2622897.1 hypothetical protein [Actinoplanes ovalisporus]